MKARARPWQISAAVDALRSAFPPPDQVHVTRATLGGTGLRMVIVGPAIENPGDLARWRRQRHRGLWIAFPVLAACPNEAAVAKVVLDAVPKLARGRRVVEIGFSRPGRGPRMGQREGLGK